jgi:tetratricopeptide (TPR) repeat protein
VAGALGFFFSSTDRHAEGLSWIEAALFVADDSVPAVDRARSCSYLGSLAAQLGDLDRGVSSAEQGLALAIESGDAWQTALSTALLAFALDAAGRPARVPGLLEEARAAHDITADPRADWGVAGCQLQAAMAAVRAGDVDGVERANRELRVRAMRLRDPVFGTWSRLLAGWAAERRGRPELAVDQYWAALDLTRPLGASPHVAFILALLGRPTMRAGELDRARSLQGEAAAMVDPARSPWFASFIHHGLAVTLRRTGEPDAAAALHRQALAESLAVDANFARELYFITLVGSPAARSLIALGTLARSRGDHGDADRLLLEGLERPNGKRTPRRSRSPWRGSPPPGTPPERPPSLARPLRSATEPGPSRTSSRSRTSNAPRRRPARHSGPRRWTSSSATAGASGWSRRSPPPASPDKAASTRPRPLDGIPVAREPGLVALLWQHSDARCSRGSSDHRHRAEGAA